MVKVIEVLWTDIPVCKCGVKCGIALDLLYSEYMDTLLALSIY
jgi:hypothetical protein